MTKQKDEQSSGVLVAIAIFKLFKAAMLIAIALVAHRLVHQDVLERATEWVRHVRVDPGNRFIHALLGKVTGLSDRRLRELSVGTLIYSALFLTEGIGLLLRKRWAEYLTVISTAGFLPLEVYELVARPRLRGAKIVLILANAAIVAYLIIRLYRSRQAEQLLNNA